MKILGPLQSIEARGTITIGPRITFSKRKSGQQARYQKSQKDVRSSGQLLQRAKFNSASLSCRYMDYGVAFFGISFFGLDKTYYSLRAKDKEMSGYNLCISEVVLDN